MATPEQQTPLNSDCPLEKLRFLFSGLSIAASSCAHSPPAGYCNRYATSKRRLSERDKQGDKPILRRTHKGNLYRTHFGLERFMWYTGLSITYRYKFCFNLCRATIKLNSYFTLYFHSIWHNKCTCITLITLSSFWIAVL